MMKVGSGNDPSAVLDEMLPDDEISGAKLKQDLHFYYMF